MLVLFPLIIVAGLVVFFFVFRKEFKEEQALALGAPRLQDLMPVQDPGTKSVEKPVSSGSAVSASAGRDELKDIKDALVQKLDQKCVKLEQILEEKNRILARLEEDLKNEQSQRQEFDGVRTILQQQIEELKMQNKQLKEELTRVLEENLALQSKAYGLEKALGGGQKVAPIVEAGAPSLGLEKEAPLTIVERPKEKDISASSQDGLTLNDIFGEDPGNEKEPSSGKI